MHPKEEPRTDSAPVDVDVSLPLDEETTNSDVRFSNDLPVFSRTPSEKRREKAAAQLRLLEVEAAVDAARAAKTAARWAIFSSAIALAALVVAAWPYVKDVGR